MLLALALRVIAFVIFVVPITLVFLVKIIKHGWNYVFYPKPRMYYQMGNTHPGPDCLQDPKLGEHGYVRTETGIKLHYVKKGDPSKPLMLFIHGFPEFWFSWRDQMEYFSNKGYWCVAMDMRGYNDSDKPNGIRSYGIDHLTSDVKSVIEGLGRSSCILVAHDWGGAVGYYFTAQWPSMVQKFITVNIPHPLSIRREQAKSWKQRLMSWYMLFFQCPILPELYFQSCDFGMLQRMMTEDAKVDENVAEAYKYAFRNPESVTAAINYYRCSFQYPEVTKHINAKIPDVPVVSIFGTADKALSVDSAKGTKDFVTNFKQIFLDGVGHWSQQERPDLVNEAIENNLKHD